MPDRYRETSALIGTFTDVYTGVKSPASSVITRRWSNLIDGAGGHYGYPNFPSDRDVGGKFTLHFSETQSFPQYLGEIQGYGPYSNISYKGSWMATLPLYGDPGFYWDGNSFGHAAVAYDKMKPDHPNMNLLNAIYELKDVPEMLRQRFQKNGLASLGSYYLGLKFGWEPLLKDVRDFVLTHLNAQKTLKQLIRDEGKPVRRRITLESASRDPVENSGPGAGPTEPLFNSYMYDGTHSQFAYRELITSKTWASAQFRYWLPPGPRDVEWKARMLAAIFGLKPTPSSVYKAIPWSWLVDWFSNVGHVISNLDTSLVDRLAADYFYVMRQDGVTRSRTSTLGFFTKGSLAPFTATSLATSFSGTKTRIKGDPFGFGTPQNSLSGVQLSILGALGLSRIR